MSAELTPPPWFDGAPRPALAVVDDEGLPVPPADVPLVGEWEEPEDRGLAVLSELGDVEYVEDLIRPGRIADIAAEEGTGKSYFTEEIAIRVACAGGSVAGTWPVVATGPVLILSEMHPDDDYVRESDILAATGHERADLAGRLYRLPTLTAAGGPPALMNPAWRDRITAWLRERGALLLIVDTATGATRIDPWGAAIQEVFASLRAMLTAYPKLAIVLVLHLKKPQGRGERRISDVLGEWGRWNDVTVLLEGDGKGAPKTKITTLKRVRHPRRIVATKRAGLLVDPIDADTLAGPKIPVEAVGAAIAAAPGLSLKALAAALQVSPSTATKYARAAEEAGLAYRVDLGAGKGFRVFPGESVLDPLTVDGPAPSNTLVGPPLDGGLEGSDGGTVQPSTHPIRVDGPPVGPPPSGPNRPPCFADADLFQAHASSRRVVDDVDVCDACVLGSGVTTTGGRPRDGSRPAAHGPDLPTNTPISD